MFSTRWNCVLPHHGDYCAHVAKGLLASSKAEEPKDEQDDDDGADDVNDLVHEFLLCVDGSSDGVPEPGDSWTMLSAAGCRVGAASHREAACHPCVTGPLDGCVPRALFEKPQKACTADPRQHPTNGQSLQSRMRVGALAHEAGHAAICARFWGLAANRRPRCRMPGCLGGLALPPFMFGSRQTWGRRDPSLLPVNGVAPKWKQPQPGGR